MLISCLFTFVTLIFLFRQRYEAASTIYGPHTLRAYMQQYAILTEKILNVSYYDVPLHIYIFLHNLEKLAKISS